MTQQATSSSDLIVEKTTALVQGIISKEAAVRPIASSDSLTDAGVSSLNMVSLMFAIEAAFDIFIPAECVNPSSFRSIDTIARMVQSIQNEAVKTTV